MSMYYLVVAGWDVIMIRYYTLSVLLYSNNNEQHVSRSTVV